ncbi:MAG: DUF3857 domain-containing protein [Flammeovirgaceae bacterium]|nr:DUF3857 domain-containing protein [Flammeovirgaceae bacterium]
MKFIKALFICFPLFASGQISYDFGKVSEAELMMQSYEKDPSAKAVIVFNRGDVELNDRLEVTMKRHVRIKFFDQTEVDEWANMTIYVSRGSSTISKIRASAYNLENGKLVESKMNEDAVFKTKINRYREEVKFAVPNVKAGSVIEYSYTIRSDAYWIPSWQFQYDIPVLETQYDTRFPYNFTFRSDVIGLLKPSRVDNEKGTRWTMTDVPAFKREPFLTTENDYISRVDFYLEEYMVPASGTIRVLQGWGSVSEGLLQSVDFGGQMRTSGFLKKIVEEQVGDEKDEQKILERLYDYVKKTIEWNEYTDVIPDHPFKKVIDEGKGSSSEINLLLVTLCLKAGLTAYPVAISDRSNGAVRAFVPMLSQFNDLICMVKSGEKQIFLDATDRRLPMKSLPMRCLNGVGLLISDAPEWVAVQAARSRLSVTSTVSIGEGGLLSGHLKITRDGLAASLGRNSIIGKGEHDYTKGLFSGKSWEVKSSSYKNKDGYTLPFEEMHEVLISDHIQDGGDRIYFNPLMYGVQVDNPFKSETREYPVDFGTTFEDIIISRFDIPEGYEIEELPQTKVLALPNNGGRFSYSTNQNGRTVSITCQLILNKAKFLVEEYSALREFYTQVVAKQAEQVVLKKKL